MANKIVDDLRKCYDSLKDEQGRWRYKPIGLLASCETSDDSIKRIKKLITVISGSDFISTETKIYMCNPTMNITHVNEEINILRNKVQSTVRKRVAPYSYSNTVKKINDDNKIITEILGNTFLKDLIHNRIESDSAINMCDSVDAKIETLIGAIGTNDKSRENLAIQIDTSLCECNSYRNNEEFFDILGSIEQYLKERMTIIENAINSDKEFVAYFNYLLSSSSINDEFVERDRERLLKFLNNEDYTTGYETNSNETDNTQSDYSDEQYDDYDEQSVSSGDNGEVDDNYINY